MKFIKNTLIFMISIQATAFAGTKTTWLSGPFKGNWYSVDSDITVSEFQKIATQYSQLVLSESDNLRDSSFPENNTIKSLHLNGQSQLTNAALQKLSKVEFLKLENCPKITAGGILKMQSLKSLYLWNMPHITDKQLATFRAQGIKVVDGRLKK